MGSYVGTYTHAADNQTVAQSKVELDISKFTLYSAEQDGTVGDNDSDLAGFFTNLADEDTLDESTTSTTAAQYATHGTDPDDSTKMIVNLYESSIFGPLAA